jgi:hypothetical protein
MLKFYAKSWTFFLMISFLNFPRDFFSWSECNFIFEIWNCQVIASPKMQLISNYCWENNCLLFCGFWWIFGSSNKIKNKIQLLRKALQLFAPKLHSNCPLIQINCSETKDTSSIIITLDLQSIGMKSLFGKWLIDFILKNWEKVFYFFRWGFPADFRIIW